MEGMTATTVTREREADDDASYPRALGQAVVLTAFAPSLSWRGTLSLLARPSRRESQIFSAFPIDGASRGQELSRLTVCRRP